MTDWTAGYVTDIGYTFGYYTELNPLRLKFAFLNAGLHFPEIGVACELGFGQGLSTNLHAASSITRWYGNDFNPSQAAFAQQLADISGADAHLFDAAFNEFGSVIDLKNGCSTNELPQFDYIGLHGIWSWISTENRAVIVDFIARKLKVGGVLYISYNTQPGWAAIAPLRDLLTEHTKVMGAAGQPMVARIDNALTFADQLIAVNPSYSRLNPNLAPRLKKIQEQNRHYLAHEYFNKDWQPMLFSQIAQWLSAAKLQYACSAHYFDHVDDLNLSAEQRELVNNLTDSVFKETVRDFCVNQMFRRDYWIKGAQKLSALEQHEQLRAQVIMLAKERHSVELKVTAGLGESTLQERIYKPILDALADYQAQSLAQLEQAMLKHNINWIQLIQAITILIGAGVIVGVQPPHISASVKARTEKLNYYLCQKARSNGDITYLASPVTGGGIAVGRFGQLFLLAKLTGLQTPEQWALYTWQILASQEQFIIKDGVTLKNPADNIAELEMQAQLFAEKSLPVLHALGIA